MQAKADYSKLSVFVELDIGTSQEDTADLSKRVKLANSFRQLKQQAGQFAKSKGIKSEIAGVVYKEGETSISVDDDEDFEIALQ